MSLPLVWGATAAEARQPYPADALLDGPTVPMTRAVTVLAPTRRHLALALPARGGAVLL